MRILKIMLIVLVLGGLAVSLLSCGPEPDEADLSENQAVTVQRGDLNIDITAVGNLALSRTEDLAFDLFYQEGTVEEVLVEEGDAVEEGQVLAKLDTEEWEDELSTLEDQVTAKERDLSQAQINLQTAEQNLKSSKDSAADRELALFNKQISLDQATYDLSVAEETHSWPDLEVAEAEVEKAEAFLQWALDGNIGSGGDTWSRLVIRAQAELDAAEKIYNAIVQGYDLEEVAIKKKQVESAEKAVTQAREDIDEVAEDVALKELQLTLNQGRLEDAQRALMDAQEELEKAKSKSPLIEAPFAGFITMVNVEGGDEVMTGTVAVQLADPDKFEAEIMVNEIDILQVKEGGEAWVQVDAMPGMSLPAEVTHISPTATIQSGVVNYEVKVELQSLQAVAQERQETRQEARPDISSGQLPERLRQAIEEGRLTQEQVEEMIKQRQQGLGGQPGGQQGQVPTMIPEDFQLREGLTVTVNILVDKRNNVLLVPNKALTSHGGETYVQVVSPDGATTERAIKTGISDWQFTEVTSGLSEGEQVVVPEATTTSTTSTSRGMPFFGPPH